MELIPIPGLILLNEKGSVLVGLSVQAEFPSISGNGVEAAAVKVRLSVAAVVGDGVLDGSRKADATAMSPWIEMTREALRWHLNLNALRVGPRDIEQAARKRLCEGSFPLLVQLSRGRLPFIEQANPGFLHLGERSDLTKTAEQCANLLLALLVGPLFDVLPEENAVVFARWDCEHPTRLEVDEQRNLHPNVRNRWMKAGVLFEGSTADRSGFAVAIYQQLASGVWNCDNHEELGGRLATAVKNATLGGWVPQRLLPGLHLFPVLEACFVAGRTVVRPECGSIDSDVDGGGDVCVDLFAVVLLWYLKTGDANLEALTNDALIPAIATKTPVLVAKSVRGAISKFPDRSRAILEGLPSAAERIHASGAKDLSLRVLEGAVLLGLLGITTTRPRLEPLDELKRAEARRRKLKLDKGKVLADITAERSNGRVPPPDWIEWELVLVEDDFRSESEDMLLRLDDEFAELTPTRRSELLHCALRQANPSTVGPGFWSLLRRTPNNTRPPRILAAMLRLHRAAHGWTQMDVAAQAYGIDERLLRAWEELRNVEIQGEVAARVLRWFDDFPVGSDQLAFLQRTFTDGLRSAPSRSPLRKDDDQAWTTRLERGLPLLGGRGLWDQPLDTLIRLASRLGASSKMIAEPVRREVLQEEERQ